ncbi:hypothetical protein LXA43DRAFT_1099668 [Ganoderma leucocontextum]|nr:hypothetical protein LXA43DRAFT_1099668 [Ganoderma leucocontextum]
MAPPETFTVKAATSPGESVWPLVLEFHKFEGEVEQKGLHAEIHLELLPPPTIGDARPTEPTTAMIPPQSVMTGSSEDPSMETEVRVARTMRKIRGTDGHFQHFHSSGLEPIPHPPGLLSQNWRQDPCDVYSHHIQGAKLPQLWVWLEHAGSYRWLSVEEGHPYRELGTSEPPSNLAFGRESVGLSHRCSPPMRSRAAPGWWGWRRRSRPIPPTSGHVQDPDAPSRPVAVQTSQLYGPGALDVLKAVTRGGCRLRNIDGEEDIHINQTAMRAAEHRGN